MNPIDSPVSVKYNNGNTFPRNFVIIAYIALAFSVVFFLSGSYILTGIVLTVSLLVITNRQIVIINEEQKFIHDYVLYLGFIKSGKKYPLDKYIYITTVPLVETHKVYARSSLSTTISNNYQVVTLFRERLKGKCEITKYNSKNEAVETATKLGERLGIKYFEYDPKLIRELILGEYSCK